jgi:hypothetical protein
MIWFRLNKGPKSSIAFWKKNLIISILEEFKSPKILAEKQLKIGGVGNRANVFKMLMLSKYLCDNKYLCWNIPQSGPLSSLPFVNKLIP